MHETDIDDHWSALSEPDRLARWIASVDGDLRVGGVIRARFTSTWEGAVRIEVCHPPDLLLTMMPETDDEATIEATLTAEGARTRLVIEEHFHGAGWQAHAEDLARYLAGGDAAWKDRWEELAAAYANLDVP